MPNLKAIGERAYKHCVAAGFRGEGVKEPSALEVHALIHSEISEATEEVRNNKEDFYYSGGEKPEGEAVECADAIIRLCEYAKVKGWQMDNIIVIKMEYNETRKHKHGGKLL